jgi:hypothetical protein
MADPESPTETDVHDVNESLDEGLKSCRHLLSEYRYLLSSSRAFGGISPPEAANDAGAGPAG